MCNVRQLTFKEVFCEIVVKISNAYISTKGRQSNRFKSHSVNLIDALLEKKMN